MDAKSLTMQAKQQVTCPNCILITATFAGSLASCSTRILSFPPAHSTAPSGVLPAAQTTPEVLVHRICWREQWSAAKNLQFPVCLGAPNTICEYVASRTLQVQKLSDMCVCCILIYRDIHMRTYRLYSDSICVCIYIYIHV